MTSKNILSGLIILLVIALLVFFTGRPNGNDDQINSTEAVPVTHTQPATDDPHFSSATIDIDEWRDQPVRHRYIHGGFDNTDTRFSMYFPPEDRYEGRFFQYITPVPDSENLSQGGSGEEDKIGFAIASGAYLIETNGGGSESSPLPGSGIDPTLGAYRANAATAQYSRKLALDMYGGQRPFGYAFGGSGGAYRTVGGLENTEGVWDGAVPFVMGSPMAIPNVFTARLYAMRVVGDKLSDVADAMDAGGSGDPYATLNDEESAALREVTQMGFPLAAWHQWEKLGMHAFPVLYPGVIAADRSYTSDFWSTPGYEGHTPPPSLLAARVQHKATVTGLLSYDEAKDKGLNVRPLAGQAKGRADSGWQAMYGNEDNQVPVAIKLSSLPDADIAAATVIAVSGDAANAAIQVKQAKDNIVVFGPGNSAPFAKLAIGDEVLIDNSDFLAVQTYHRHQVPGPEYTVWDQFRDEAGKPLYPQRPMILGPIFAMNASGTVPKGVFKGKMILLENLYDTEAFAWQADWYRSRVIEHLGDKTDSHFRLWMTDRTNHRDSTQQSDPTYTVSYIGALQLALHQLANWVEKGIEPASTSQYTVDNGQTVLPPSADVRGGIQPVVRLSANGSSRARITQGDIVTLQATIELPPNTGSLLSAEWDFDGKGNYPEKTDLNTVEQNGNQWVITLEKPFEETGTWFPTIRVASQHAHYAGTPFAQVQNLARARVIVK